MSDITWSDKDKTQPAGTAPATWRDIDANEVKNVVNNFRAKLVGGKVPNSQLPDPALKIGSSTDFDGAGLSNGFVVYWNAASSKFKVKAEAGAPTNTDIDGNNDVFQLSRSIVGDAVTLLVGLQDQDEKLVLAAPKDATGTPTFRRLDVNDIEGLVAPLGLVIPIKNQTGSAISKGQALGYAGTVGALGRILVDLFTADGSGPSDRFVGLAYTDLAIDAEGYALWFGELTNVDTSSFAAEDILYASPTVAGDLTDTKPSFPNNVISVASVVRDHPTTGILFVRPKFEFLNGGGSEDEVAFFDANGNLVGNTGLYVDNDIRLNVKGFRVINAHASTPTAVIIASDNPEGTAGTDTIETRLLMGRGADKLFQIQVRSQDTFGRKPSLVFLKQDETGQPVEEIVRITNAGNLRFNGTRKLESSTGDLTLETLAGNGDVILKPHGTGEVVAESNVKAELIYSEEITVTLSTIGNAVTVKTFATTDKAIFTVSAIPTGNKAGYQTANFFKGYDGTNSLFYKSASGSLNFQVNADSITGVILEAEPTAAAMENEEIKVKILYLNK